MDNAHIETLIQESVDGVITAADDARLAAFLATDPDARRTLEDYRKIAGIVGKMPSQPAPKGFAKRVMQSLPKSAAPAPARPSFGDLVARFFGAPQARLVYAAVAGAVVAAAVTFSVIKPLPADVTGLSATMGAAPDATISVDAGTAGIDLSATRAGGLIGLTLSADAAASGSASFDASRFRIVDIRYVSGDVSAMQAEGGIIAFTTQGPGSVHVRLDGAVSAPAQFVVNAAATSGTLELPAAE